jgi:hemerythrin-like domain-containing protein
MATAALCVLSAEQFLMGSHEITEQTRVEHELLHHLMHGLRSTAAWRVQEPNATRKLSTLRFIVQSFQRHLEHLLTIEEYDGYMGLLQSAVPRLAQTTDTLRDEHDQFRDAARWIVQQLERLPTTDLPALGQVCDDLLALVGRIEEHNRKEIALIQETLGRDEGGEA